MKHWWCLVIWLMPALASIAEVAAAPAALNQYGLLDIYIGDDYATLQQQLDMRDINSALAELKKPGRPDLGKRGYGCSLRDDEYADITCVSHDEMLAGIQTREIRLQFLDGDLQQMSLTAEAQYYDAVVTYLQARFGKGKRVNDKLEWQNAKAHMYALRGANLVFVSIELKSYMSAVARNRARNQ